MTNFVSVCRHVDIISGTKHEGCLSSEKLLGCSLFTLSAKSLSVFCHSRGKTTESVASVLWASFCKAGSFHVIWRLSDRSVIRACDHFNKVRVMAYKHGKKVCNICPGQEKGHCRHSKWLSFYSLGGIDAKSWPEWHHEPSPLYCHSSLKCLCGHHRNMSVFGDR